MKADQLVCNANELTGLMQISALYDIEGLFNNLSKSFISNLCVKICKFVLASIQCSSFT